MTHSCIDDATIKFFADDTNLFVSGQSIDEVTAIANMCISKLNTWFLANKLSLNLDKTCFSVCGVHDDNDPVSYTHLTLPTIYSV